MQLANKWKQSGRISLWRYTENERNYPGWHINADLAGCQSLLNLLDALAADGSGSRTVTIIAPTRAQLRVPNNKAGLAAWLAPEKLTVTLSSIPEGWSFPAELDPAVITLGSDWLAQLRQGITAISENGGDYSIGNRKDGQSLWFWW